MGPSLKNSVNDSVSNSVSTWFDVGGIIGGVVGGIGSDIWGHRSPVVFGMAILAVPSLLGLRNSPNDKGRRFLLRVFPVHYSDQWLRCSFFYK